jgi:hypothetical protein
VKRQIKKMITWWTTPVKNDGDLVGCIVMGLLLAMLISLVTLTLQGKIQW